MSERFRANFIMRRKKNNDKDRPEQLLIAEVLQHHLSPNVTVKTEQVIHYITESHRPTHAKIDIYVVYQGKEYTKPMEYLLRVMGEYHDSKFQTRKDDLQRSYLMALPPPLRNIATVYDLWYHKMPVTFKRNKQKLSKVEIKESYNEIFTQCKRFFDLPKDPLESWLNTSIHIR